MFVKMSTEWLSNLPRVDEPDVNRGPTLLAVSISLTLLALVIVALRFHARLYILKSPGADVSEYRPQL